MTIRRGTPEWLAREAQYRANRTPEQVAAKAAYMRAYREAGTAPCYAPQKQREYQQRTRHRRAGTPEWIAKQAAQNKKHRDAYAHTPEYKAVKAAWQKAHPERQKMSSLKHREALRAEMLTAYGNQCACCGETEPIFLTLDHTNGNGADDRRAFRASGNLPRVRALKREGWPRDGYRLLCWNCQYGSYRLPICPHAA